MSLLKRIFTRRTRRYGVWVEIRFREQVIHKFAATVDCKWKFQAKERVRNEMKITAGMAKKIGIKKTA